MRSSILLILPLRVHVKSPIINTKKPRAVHPEQSVSHSSKHHLSHVTYHTVPTANTTLSLHNTSAPNSNHTPQHPTTKNIHKLTPYITITPLNNKSYPQPATSRGDTSHPPFVPNQNITPHPDQPLTHPTISQTLTTLPSQPHTPLPRNPCRRTVHHTTLHPNPSVGCTSVPLSLSIYHTSIPQP